MIKLVLASNNKGKLKEFDGALGAFDISLVPQKEFGVPDAIEDGLSFIENAIIKARHASKLTQHPALADDSGLAVDILGGQPGIYSSRYSGHGDAANNEKLLAEMMKLDSQNRTARFHCCLALVRHWEDPTPIIINGTWEGSIAHDLQGMEGFGYDPLFIPAEFDCRAAQLTKVEKSAISHRGQAIAKLVEFLNEHPQWL